MATACARHPKNGYEITGGEFDNLIIGQRVRSLAFVQKDYLIEVELKPSALDRYRKEIEKLKAERKITTDEEFRLYLMIVDIDYFETRIRKIEKEYGLKAISIERK